MIWLHIIHGSTSMHTNKGTNSGIPAWMTCTLVAKSFFVGIAYQFGYMIKYIHLTIYKNLSSYLLSFYEKCFLHWLTMKSVNKCLTI